jgi:hypothetical protein
MGVELTADNRRLLEVAELGGLDGKNVVRQCLRLYLGDRGGFSETAPHQREGEHGFPVVSDVNGEFLDEGKEPIRDCPSSGS